MNPQDLSSPGTCAHLILVTNKYTYLLHSSTSNIKYSLQVPRLCRPAQVCVNQVQQFPSLLSSWLQNAPTVVICGFMNCVSVFVLPTGYRQYILSGKPSTKWPFARCPHLSSQTDHAIDLHLSRKRVLAVCTTHALLLLPKQPCRDCPGQLLQRALHSIFLVNAFPCFW